MYLTYLQSKIWYYYALCRCSDYWKMYDGGSLLCLLFFLIILYILDVPLIYFYLRVYMVPSKSFSQAYQISLIKTIKQSCSFQNRFLKQTISWECMYICANLIYSAWIDFWSLIFIDLIFIFLDLKHHHKFIALLHSGYALTS